MRRVLIDECLPVQLHRWLAPLDARTVEFQGGQGLRNGELLARATGTFDVLLTVDALLADEHDFAALGLGVVPLQTNRIKEIRRLLPEIRTAVVEVSAGAVLTVRSV
jgi:predicted nuclease of predicted toxin-antitoxin system